MSEEFSGIPPIADRLDWNAVIDHALEKAASFILRPNGDYAEAIYGCGSNQAGKLVPNGKNLLSESELTVQAIVDALPTRFGLIYVKPADYIFNLQFTSPEKTAVLVENKILTLYGEGYCLANELKGGAMFQLANGANCRLIHSIPTGGNNTNSINLFGMQFDGNRTYQTETHPLIYVDGAGIRIRDSYISRCVFRNATGQPLYLKNPIDTWIHNNAFEDSSDGVRLEFINYYVHFYDNYLHGLGGEYGLYLRGVGGTGLCFIHDNSIGNWKYGIGIYNLNKSKVHDNIIFGAGNQAHNTWDAMRIWGSLTQELNVHDNTFISGLANKPKYDIHLVSDCDYVWVRNNICKSWVTEAIKVEAGVNPNGVVELNVT